jgi:predicted phosphate transport protein (TIGR00153 family)
MGLRDLFKPKPDKFLILLVEQTRVTVKGLDLLKKYLTRQSKESARELSAAEKQADEIRRIVIEELMKTFVTPFDREDIFSLSREIDDVLDYANTTVDEMEILEVSPTPYMARMAALLLEAAQEIELAVERLQDKHYSVASDHAQRAKSFENRVEAVYREAIADLFRGPKNIKHVMTMLKVREIYRHLSNAADREDTAANVIADIIMKMG